MSDPARPDEEPTRPTWACATCLPPSPGRTWARADPSFATCSSCYTRLRDQLAEVDERFLLLDPRPGASNEQGSRGAPGFVSRPPLNLGVVAMRDPRSSRDAYTWLAADGRVHHEELRPPLSVQSVLSTVAWSVAEFRGMAGPADDAGVHDLVRWLDNRITDITRHGELVTELSAALRELLGQLRPRTGDSRKKVGTCPVTIDEGGSTRECGTALYAPLASSGSDVIRCPACGEKWEQDEWLHLGDLLNSVPRED